MSKDRFGNCTMEWRLRQDGQSPCANARTALGFETKTDRWGAAPKQTYTFYGHRRALLNSVLECFRICFAMRAGWRGVCVHDASVGCKFAAVTAAELRD